MSHTRFRARADVPHGGRDVLIMTHFGMARKLVAHLGIDLAQEKRTRKQEERAVSFEAEKSPLLLQPVGRVSDLLENLESLLLLLSVCMSDVESLTACFDEVDGQRRRAVVRVQRAQHRLPALLHLLQQEQRSSLQRQCIHPARCEVHRSFDRLQRALLVVHGQVDASENVVALGLAPRILRMAAIGGLEQFDRLSKRSKQ